MTTNFSSIGDWSTSANSNTTLDALSIAENCNMNVINNGLRSIMAGVVGYSKTVDATGGDTYTATLTPVPDNLNTGMTYHVNFKSANTSTNSTLKFNSFASATVVRMDGSALNVGDLNGPSAVQFDGTSLRVLSPNKVAAANVIGSISSTSSSTSGNVAIYNTSNGTSITDSGFNLGAFSRPTGRLTLATGAPVMTGDGTSGTVFYTPYVGNTVPINNGTIFTPVTFSETTLTLDGTGHTSGHNYDVFGWNNSGTFAVGTAAAWASDTSRGTATAITMVGGLWVNNTSVTLRNNSTTASVSLNQATYLGTFRTTSGGTTSQQFKPSPSAGGSANVLGLYNAYNRVTVRSLCRDGTGSNWTYASNTPRPANNNTGNRVSFVDGLQQSNVQALYKASNNATSAAGIVGVGLNTTNAFSGIQGLNTQASQDIDVTGHDEFTPVLGFNFVQALEAAGSAATTTFLSTSSGAQLQGLIVTLEM